MQDCRDDKIDLILTKSVSRFGRNVVDCLNSIRELKAIGVAPCEAMDVMSFKVPDALFTDRHCIFRICSKQFIRNVMSTNGMNLLQSYSFDGFYSEKQNIIMFMLKNTGMEE